MRSIMIVNVKGGSGKSTLATNLAAYYACSGKKVVLADCDLQESSLAWLDARPAKLPEIQGIAAHKDALRVKRGTEIVIFDTPASMQATALAQWVRRSQTLIIPVLPSPIDIRACTTFLQTLKAMPFIAGKKAKIGIVANRARSHTNIFLELDRFLEKLRGVSYITALRDSTNYIRAADSGISIFEMAPSATAVDLAEWQPLISWLNSKRSQP